MLISNELYYNETAYLQVELINNSSLTVKDLALHLKASNLMPNVEYNPLTMVEEIQANASKTISIKLSADEDVSENSYTLGIKLANINGGAIDNQAFILKTVGLSSYYTGNETNKTETNTNPYYNNNRKYESNTPSKSSDDTCSKGCSGAGL